MEKFNKIYIKSPFCTSALPAYLGKMHKNFENDLFHIKVTVFTSILPAHQALFKCPNGQSAPMPRQQLPFIQKKSAFAQKTFPWAYHALRMTAHATQKLNMTFLKYPTVVNFVSNSRRQVRLMLSVVRVVQYQYQSLCRHQTIYPSKRRFSCFFHPQKHLSTKEYEVVTNF